MRLTCISFVYRHYTPYICIPTFIMVFRQYLLDAVNAITGNLNKTDAVSVIQKLYKSFSLAVLCEAALVSISSHRETMKNSLNILELVRHCDLPVSLQHTQNVMSDTEKCAIKCHQKQYKKLESQKSEVLGRS